MAPSSVSSSRSTSGRRRAARGGSDERLRRSQRAQEEAVEGARRALEQVAAKRDEVWRQSAEATRRRVRIVLFTPFALGLVLCLLGILLLPLVAVGAVLLLAWGLIALRAWRAACSGPVARLQGTELRQALAAGLVPAVAAERYEDLAQSLCDALGLSLPGLFVIVDPAMNAISFGDRQSARLYLTTGLLARLDRIELEGVLAHELSHLKRLDSLSGGLATGLLRGGLLPLPGAAGLARWLEGPRREIETDLVAVQATRYPPGLLGALAKAAGEEVAVRPANALDERVIAETAGQWLVPLRRETEEEVGGFGLEERLAVLQEL